MLRAVFASALIVVLGGGAHADSEFVERSTHRFAGTYAVTPVVSTFDGASGVAACRTLCASDTRCVAWSYVRPGLRGPEAVCELKDVITQPEPSPCCHSGIIPRHDAEATLVPAAAQARQDAPTPEPKLLGR